MCYAEYKICEMRVKYKIQNTKIQNTKYKIQNTNTKYKIQNTDVENTECNMQISSVICP